jgi:ComF family protein
VRFLPPPQLLVPVPLTSARLRERGFNQSVEIARVVSRAIRVPARMRALERTRDAPSQSGLKRRQRRANLRGAFRGARPLEGLHVALVDDVFTTGATAQAATAALQRAGAMRVDVWAIARTPGPGQACCSTSACIGRRFRPTRAT